MSSEAASIRVAVVEDRADLREGLVALLGAEPDFVVTGAYESMEAGLAGMGARPPHVALIDLGLPGMNGIEGIRQLRQRQPDVIPLVLTVFGDDDRIFEALCSGACGYLLKNTKGDRLIEGIRDAMRGGAPISPEIAQRVVALFRVVRPPERADHDLTPHEQRLLRLLVEGHSYQSAAEVLGCSYHTVNSHLKKIYVKLQVHSKSEAVAKALRAGMIV
ncbi:MAG: response regulator transcription factor [Acidobacteria bacterium]|nr:response regulator transcription factor [Acidobacteriota bacterium]